MKAFNIFDCKTSEGYPCPYLNKNNKYVINKIKYECLKLNRIYKHHTLKLYYGYPAWLFKKCPLKDVMLEDVIIGRC